MTIAIESTQFDTIFVYYIMYSTNKSLQESVNKSLLVLKSRLLNLSNIGMATCISKSFSTRLSRHILFAGLLAVLSGCQTIQKLTTQADNNPDIDNPSESQEIQTSAKSQLRSELLYDILVAFIATQRNQPEIALEVLSRVSHQHRERHLITESIRLAMINGKFHRVIELAQLLDTLDPANYLITLSLVKAQLNLGKVKPAFGLLLDLTKKYNENHNHIFKDIASLIISQRNTVILDQFWNLVEDHPDNLALQMASAFVSSSLRQPGRHFEQLNKILEIRPDWELPAILILTQLSNNDSTGKSRRTADTYASKHLKVYPEQIQFRLQFARHLIQNNDLDSAIDQLNNILGRNSNIFDALHASGVIHFEKGNIAKSKGLFTRYLQLNPHNDQVLIYLSDIESRQGNHIAALNYLYGVVSPRYYLDAQVKLAAVVAKRYDVNLGLEHLQQIDVVSDKDKVRLILEQNLLLRKHGQMVQSKQVLDDGLKQFPDHPDLLYNRGLLAAEMSLAELHERDMRKLIEIQPDNAHAYNALGYFLANRVDRLEEAMALIKKANALLPNNAFILDSMGWAHFRMGNHNKALEYLRLALDARKDAEIAAHLGEVLWVAGNRNKACKIWGKGIEWEPESEILKQTIKQLLPPDENDVYCNYCNFPY